jgi:hypothetical protein
MSANSDVKGIAGEIHSKRIVLTNNEAVMYTQANTTQRTAFEKLQRMSSVSGKTQYWSYRIIKKIIDIVEDVEKSRMNLVKDFCKKDEKGEPILIGGEYQFDPEQKKLFDKEIPLEKPIPQEVIDKIAEKYCRRNDKGEPIKSKGNMYTFSPEGGESFQKSFMELLEQTNVLPFDRVAISTTVLEKMQSNLKPDECLTMQDMLLLDKLFEFVE